MNSGYYAACAGLVARTDALELAANNLANLNTTAYKAQKGYFQSLVAGLAGRADVLNRAANDFGVLGGARLDLSAGNFEKTRGDLDLAIEGAGFFVVQTGKGRLYTRNGSFRVSQSGQLTTAAGEAVMGEQGPIRIPSGPVSISSDGTVSSGGAVVAKLRVVELDGASLKAEGNTMFSAPVGAEKAAPQSRVRQGFLEAANIDPVTAFVDLVGLQRHAETLQRVLTMFHTEFNRTAAEDLPRA